MLSSLMSGQVMTNHDYKQLIFDTLIAAQSKQFYEINIFIRLGWASPANIFSSVWCYQLNYLLNQQTSWLGFVLYQAYLIMSFQILLWKYLLGKP